MADSENDGKLYVDIKKLIQIHNQNNPEDKVDRRGLAKKINTSYQTLTNYNNGLIPSGFDIINSLLEVSGAKYEEVVKKVKRKKINKDEKHKRKTKRSI